MNALIFKHGVLWKGSKTAAEMQARPFFLKKKGRDQNLKKILTNLKKHKS